MMFDVPQLLSSGNSDIERISDSLRCKYYEIQQLVISNGRAGARFDPLASLCFAGMRHWANNPPVCP